MPFVLVLPFLAAVAVNDDDDDEEEEDDDDDDNDDDGDGDGDEYEYDDGDGDDDDADDDDDDDDDDDYFYHDDEKEEDAANADDDDDDGDADDHDGDDREDDDDDDADNDHDDAAADDHDDDDGDDDDDDVGDDDNDDVAADDDDDDDDNEDKAADYDHDDAADDGGDDDGGDDYYYRDDCDDSTGPPAGIRQLAARLGRYQESPGFKWDGGAGKLPTPNIHDKRPGSQPEESRALSYPTGWVCWRLLTNNPRLKGWILHNQTIIGGSPQCGGLAEQQSRTWTLLFGGCLVCGWASGKIGFSICLLQLPALLTDPQFFLLFLLPHCPSVRSCARQLDGVHVS